MIAVGLLADMMGDQPYDRLGRIGGDRLGQRRAPGGDAVDPDPAIGITITSTTRGSASAPAIAGPSARRNAWNSRPATMAFFTGMRQTPVLSATRCRVGPDAIPSNLTWKCTWRFTHVTRVHRHRRT
jgi:hypothetical protein